MNQVDSLSNLMISSIHSGSVTKSLLVLTLECLQTTKCSELYTKRRVHCKQESETCKNQHYKTIYTYIAIVASAAQQCEEQ